MDYYHWWIYVYIFNTKWFVWSVVLIVFAFNLLGFVLLWLVMNSKSILPQKGKKKKQLDITES